MNTQHHFKVGDHVVGGLGEDRDVGKIAEPLTRHEIYHPMNTPANVFVRWSSGVSTWTPLDEINPA